MRSDIVVIAGIASQDSAQMGLAANDDMIQALATDRPDQPFGKAILPGSGRCNRLVTDAHGAQSARDDRAVDAIPVPDHATRSLVPGECLSYLTRDPFGGRMCRDIDPDE